MHSMIAGNHGGDDKSFHKIVLYDTQKVFCTEWKSVWPGDRQDVPSGPQYCQSLALATFTLRRVEYYTTQRQYTGPKFTIGCVHAPVLQQGRDEYFKILKTYSNNPDACLFIGDFNLIFDLGGAEHEAELNSCLVPLSKDIGTTFIGFPHDCDPETGIPWQSSFDRCFANQSFMNIVDSVDVNAENAMIDDVRISDHFVLKAAVQFK